jgi:hypothetical protein
LINSDENGSAGDVRVEVRIQRLDKQQIVQQSLWHLVCVGLAALLSSPVRVLRHEVNHGDLKHALEVPMRASVEVGQRHSLVPGFHNVLQSVFDPYLSALESDQTVKELLAEVAALALNTVFVNHRGNGPQLVVCHFMRWCTLKMICKSF